jgi:hypothetical protein
LFLASPLCSYIFRCLLLRIMLRISNRLCKVLFGDLKVMSLSDPLAMSQPCVHYVRRM